MPRQPANSPEPADAGAATKKLRSVPTENVEVLKNTLGVDVTSMAPGEVQALALALSRSMSASPYSSAQMLQEYRDGGFPDLPGKIIKAIDDQTAHRQALERMTAERQEAREDRAQWGAQVVAVLGLVGSLVAGYAGVPATVCIVGIVVSIGGPSAATVIGRVMDRLNRG